MKFKNHSPTKNTDITDFKDEIIKKQLYTSVKLVLPTSAHPYSSAYGIQVLNPYQEWWKRWKLCPMPFIILWPVKRIINLLKGKMYYVNCSQYPWKELLISTSWKEVPFQREKKRYKKKENIRCFPLASVESIILRINNLPFPKGYNLRNIKM